MGWFSRFVKKAVEAVVEPVVTYVVEPITTHVVEPIVTHVIEPIVTTTTSVVTAVVETVSDAVEGAVQTLVNAGTSIATAAADLVVEYAPDVAYAALTYFVDNNIKPTDYDPEQFAPIEGATRVANTETVMSEWTAEETIMVRDTIAMTQAAFADFSALFATGKGIVDADGYVLNEDLLYQDVEWVPGLETWMQERFDFIRVQECTVSPLFEANVSLFQSYETGDYFVAIGGTSGLSDIVTDVTLTVLGETFSQFGISSIIEGFFADDIEEGATVHIAGASLGGAEALLQYRSGLFDFDEAFLLVPAGIGGVHGTHYDRNVWSEDKIGDANITEINMLLDNGQDANDFVTSLGHVGAGQTFIIDEFVMAEGYDDDPFVASHLNRNHWASVTGGENPELPIVDTAEDVFMFA